jgi:hypothetical protein
MSAMNILRCAAKLLVISVAVAAGSAHGQTANLIGDWKFAGNARDSAGANHGVAHGEVFLKDKPGARLNGRDQFIEIPSSDSLQLGAKSFSVSVWVDIPADADDRGGDLLSMYDAARRRGLQLSIARRDAATSGQSNPRQIEFGIDNGRLDDTPIDRGRPGEAVYIFGLIVFDGRLYAATCEPGEKQAGHLYRYEGEQRWKDCGSPDRANGVTALAVHRGRLYAATGKYRLRGSALPESTNPTHGGHVYRFEEPGRFTDCGKLGESEAIGGFTTYQGQLHASSIYSPGVYRYEDNGEWTSLGTPEGRRVEALTVFQDALYGGGYDKGEVYRYRPDEGWKIVGQLPGVTQTYGFGVYGGKLHVGAWPNGDVFRLDSEDRWTNVGRLGEEKEVMPLVSHNGKLYGGTLPLAALFRYEQADQWTRLIQLDRTPEVQYRRVFAMTVFEGELYSGTLPSGHVYSVRAGRSATRDHALAKGLHHVLAVREAERLRLYVDGEAVAASASFDAADYNLSCEHPLKIGFGTTEYFRGAIRGVRLYNRALTLDDSKKLAAERP